MRNTYTAGRFPILPQPDLETCGATSLHSVYRFWDDEIDLAQVIAEVPSLEDGGTLGVLLGTHALNRGYAAAIYSYHLQVFDPTWSGLPQDELVKRLAHRHRVRTNKKLRRKLEAYQEFLGVGGKVFFEDLTPALISRWLNRGVPLLAGLSATYLYRCPRELGENYDDVGGDPVGHFVVLYGYRDSTRTVLVADPLKPNPIADEQEYEIDVQRVINSILLGVLTNDANLLVIQPEEIAPVE